MWCGMGRAGQWGTAGDGCQEQVREQEDCLWRGFEELLYLLKVTELGWKANLEERTCWENAGQGQVYL